MVAVANGDAVTITVVVAIIVPLPTRRLMNHGQLISPSPEDRVGVHAVLTDTSVGIIVASIIYNNLYFFIFFLGGEGPVQSSGDPQKTQNQIW